MSGLCSVSNLTFGLVWLMLEGIQDEFLTGTPVFTLFKSAYAQYTKFSAIDTIMAPTNGSNDLSVNEQQLSCTRGGDLGSGMHLLFTLPALMNVQYISSKASQLSATGYDTECGVAVDAFGNKLKVDAVALGRTAASATYTTEVADALADQVDKSASVAVSAVKPQSYGRLCKSQTPYNNVSFLPTDYATSAGTTFDKYYGLINTQSTVISDDWVLYFDAEAALAGVYGKAAKDALANNGNAITDIAGMENAIRAAVFVVDYWKQMFPDTHNGYSYFATDSSHDAAERQITPNSDQADGGHGCKAQTGNTKSVKYEGCRPAKRTPIHYKCSDVVVDTCQNVPYELVESSDARAAKTLQAAKNDETFWGIAGPEPCWTYAVGFALIDCISLCVGQSTIEKNYGDYLNCWDELMGQKQHSTAMYDDEHITEHEWMTQKSSLSKRKIMAQQSLQVLVRVSHTFARTAGTAMPLIALQFHHIGCSLMAKRVEECVINHGNTIMSRGGYKNNHTATNNSTTTPAATGDYTHGIHTGDLIEDSIYTCTRADVNASSRPGIASESKIKLQTLESPGATKQNPRYLKQGDVKVNLTCQLFFLTSAERQKVTDGSCEMLLCQVQRVRHSLASNQTRTSHLAFNHPASALVAFVKSACNDTRPGQEALDMRAHLDPIYGQAQHTIDRIQLFVNNSPVSPATNGCESIDLRLQNALNSYHKGGEVLPECGLACYAWSQNLAGAAQQPSGSFNLSRCDSLQLHVELNAAYDLSRRSDTLAREARLITSAGCQASNSCDAASDCCCADPVRESDVIANCLLNPSAKYLYVYVTTYNILRLKNGLCGTQYA